MRITFVLAGGFNLAGGDRVISIYAEKLMKRGHQVLVVACPAYPPTPRKRLSTLVRERRWLSDPVPGPSHFSHSPVPHVRLKTFRPVQSSDVPDADVVISTWWE